MVLKSSLKTVQFSNYNIFLNVNVAYSDLLNKISDKIDNVAPIKEIRIKITHKTGLSMRLQKL